MCRVAIYKLATKMFSETSESILIVPPLILTMHWLPFCEQMTSASTPGYKPIDAIRAQIFLLPVTLHTLTLPVCALLESATTDSVQVFLLKQLLSLSLKQQPFMFLSR